jgi:hypothetical protein
MSTDEKLPDALTQMGDDGYNDVDDDDDRRIQGGILKFTSADLAAPWKRTDGSPIAARYLAVGLCHVLQRWQNKRRLDEITERPFPSLDELNAQIPREQWELGMNGPRPPWQHSYFVYLCEPNSMDTCTFVSYSIGGGISYSDLKKAVALKRRLTGGAVLPLVALGVRTMKTRFGARPRPHFEIVSWHGAEDEPVRLEKPTPQAKPRVIADDPGALDDEIPF